MPKLSWKSDGWDVSARLGIVVPHADVGPESELRAMAPPEIGVHAARIYFGAMRPGGVMDEKIPHDPVTAFTQEPFIDDTIGLLAAAPLDAIGCAFTSSAYKHGPEGEAKLVERLRERSFNIPVTTTCSAAVSALHAVGARTIGLINPPWFDTELDAAGCRYFQEQGFAVAWHAPAGVTSSPSHITPGALADWIRTCDVTAVDAIFVGGNGFRAIGVIDALEKQLGVSILTANQVVLWRCLQLSGAQTRIDGYGRLLASMSEAPQP